MIHKLFRWLPLISCCGLISCKEPQINNVQIDGDRKYLNLECPPYGGLRFMVDDGQALDEEWTNENTECLNWIQDNWKALWPIVESKFEEMAARYADGEKRLEDHLKNEKNTLYIRPGDDGHWSVSLSLIKERSGPSGRPGSNSFCLDMDRDKVLDYQLVY